MNFWPRLQKVLSADEAKKGAVVPDPKKGTHVKALPEDAYILIPLRNAVLFPGAISPITIGRASSIAAAQEAVRTGRHVGFLLQRDREKNDVGPADLYWVGTSGQIARYVTGGEGAHHLVVQGQSRFRVLEFLEGWPFLVARVAIPRGAKIEPAMLTLKCPGDGLRWSDRELLIGRRTLRAIEADEMIVAEDVGIASGRHGKQGAVR